MDERARKTARQAATGDSAAREASRAAERRSGASIAAQAILETFRELVGEDYDRQRKHRLKLKVDQAAALVAAAYRAQGWTEDKKGTGKLLAPDGQRRLVWGSYQRTMRRERKGEGRWIRDERCDPPGKILHTTGVARTLLDQAIKEGRLAEEPVGCTECAGWGWRLVSKDEQGWGLLEHCSSCGRHQGSAEARDSLLCANVIEEAGSRVRVLGRDRTVGILDRMLRHFLYFQAQLDTHPESLERVLHPEAVLELRGARTGVRCGRVAIIADLKKQPLASRAREVDEVEDPARGTISATYLEYGSPAVLGTIKLWVRGGSIARIEIEVNGRN